MHNHHAPEEVNDEHGEAQLTSCIFPKTDDEVDGEREDKSKLHNSMCTGIGYLGDSGFFGHEEMALWKRRSLPWLGILTALSWLLSKG